VSNLGRARFTAAIAPYTAGTTTTTVVIPGPPGVGPFPITLPGQPAAATGPAPAASVTNTATGATLNFRYTNTSANPGTTGPSDFIVTSVEAINIPGNVHAFQNNRDPVSAGTVFR